MFLNFRLHEPNANIVNNTYFYGVSTYLSYKYILSIQIFYFMLDIARYLRYYVLLRPEIRWTITKDRGLCLDVVVVYHVIIVEMDMGC